MRGETADQAIRVLDPIHIPLLPIRNGVRFWQFHEHGTGQDKYVWPVTDILHDPYRLAQFVGAYYFDGKGQAYAGQIG